MPDLDSQKQLGLDVYFDNGSATTVFLSYFLDGRIGRHRVTQATFGVQVGALSLRENQAGDRDEIAIFGK